MNALIFVLFAIVLVLVIVLFCKLAALSSHYDDLMDKVFKQEECLQDCNKRFEMHHKDIANNQRTIDEKPSVHDFQALKRELDAVREELVLVKEVLDEKNAAETLAEDAAETDAEDEPTERQARQPYSKTVREMAEKFIIAEYSTTSIKTMAKLLNIPRATVQRWTKQLIKRGAIQPKKQETQE